MGHKILIVEDEESHRTLLERTLRREGFEPVFAADGEQGIAMVQQENPDLVLLDWNLPKLNGGQVARWIRKNSRFSHIPILMLTIRDRAEEQVVGFESGADDYQTKPYSPKELVARIQRLLKIGG